MRICLVTTEYPNIGPSGGIGTYVRYLSEILSPIHEIVIFHAGTEEDLSAWDESQLRISFKSLYDAKRRDFSGGENYHYENSLRVYDWLKQNCFDIVNFPDWQALGYASVVAKKAGIAFASTELTITIHGPSVWTLEASKNWEALVDINTSHVDYMEMKSIEYSDRVFSPSKYIAEWVRNHAKINREFEVMSYPFIPKTNISNKSENSDYPKVAFFGRLEQRKGIFEFLDAISFLKSPSSFKFFIIGRNINHRLIEERYSKFNWFKDLEFREFNNSIDSVEFITKEIDLVVIPSLDDNSPFTVREMADLGSRLLTSNVGGIPELLPEDNLCNPDAKTIALKLDLFIDDPTVIPRAKYLGSFAHDNNLWKEAFSVSRCIPSDSNKINIGVVIAHYNQSQYLKDAIESVKNQTYKEFKCFVVDDGSESSHQSLFEELKEVYRSDKRFTFFIQENTDVGKLRNTFAEMIDCDAVAFLDADDCMKEDCLRLYALTLSSGFDIATSHFDLVNENYSQEKPISKFKFGSYEPYGPNLKVSWLRNVIGGANFAVKKNVFSSLGGFEELRGSTHHDWKFLVRASVLNYAICSIPERLLTYRVLNNSMSRQRNYLEGQRGVLSEYSKLEPQTANNLLTYLMNREIYRQNSLGDNTLQSSTYRLVKRIQKFALSIAPYGGIRWRLMASVYRKLTK